MGCERLKGFRRKLLRQRLGLDEPVLPYLFHQILQPNHLNGDGEHPQRGGTLPGKIYPKRGWDCKSGGLAWSLALEQFLRFFEKRVALGVGMFVAQFCKFLQSLFLRRVQVFRDFNLDSDMKIASCTS